MLPLISLLSLTVGFPIVNTSVESLSFITDLGQDVLFDHILNTTVSVYEFYLYNTIDYLEVDTLEEAQRTVNKLNGLLIKPILIKSDQSILSSVPNDYKNDHIPSFHEALDNTPSIEDAIDQTIVPRGIPFFKPKVTTGKSDIESSVNGKGTFLLTKVDDLVSKFIPEEVPITPCLDSTFGDGGSISFSVGNSQSISASLEGTAAISFMVTASITQKYEKTVSKSHSTSFGLNIPQGSSGQLFIQNPRILSGIAKTTILKMTKGLWELGTSATQNIDVLDSSLEYKITSRVFRSEQRPLHCKIPYSLL
ncbi:hypothetical protein CLIB1444_07S02674 [[Candida] jaroonii]|uniref:Uncharacterized protein n=1 Tax=[Candida] jaroonii TaxID=467808 RepID=A0ACA9Y9R2_9ASCO|nr:hypothetical protein CLIB1444_07S02674 [[Candida] jaroonii]